MACSGRGAARLAGLAGLADAPRWGRPPTYTEAQRSRVIAKARSRPPTPASGEVPPTCHWTLEQVQRELEREGLPIKRSQIRRFLRAEHIRWQKPRTWLQSDDHTVGSEPTDDRGIGRAAPDHP
jgi:transposase